MTEKKTLRMTAKILTALIHSFIHLFINHSVNPYKVNQPMGYRACHDTNVI